MTRQCGDCGQCCRIMGVEALAKPPGKRCRHYSRARGCTIYDDRPGDCRVFNCLWLLTDALDEEWKPSVSGFVLHSDAGRLIVEADPSRPHDWRRAPYEATLRLWAAAGQDVLIFVGKRGLRLGPHTDTSVRRAD